MEKSFAERVADATAAVQPVSPERARALSESAPVRFLDPRPADAIASTTGLIPGAVVVPLSDIAAGRLPEAFADRSVHVIAACQGGPMGAIAAHELSKLGFANVNYVDGGTQGWLDAGFPTQR